MDQVMNKLGSYWVSKRADKEISSVGDDLNVTSLIVSPHIVSHVLRVSIVVNGKKKL